jgi:Mitochondrial carrier protein
MMTRLIQETIQKEGIRGLYRGFGVHVGGSIPAGGLYYGSYEFFKKNTLQNEFLQKHAFLAYLMGGVFAETISCIIFVPVDVIKERRQVQANMNSYKYKGDIDAFRQILKTEGLRGLYRAYGATVGSFGPFSALYFMFYEHIKGFFVNNDAQAYLQRNKSG